MGHNSSSSRQPLRAEDRMRILLSNFRGARVSVLRTLFPGLPEDAFTAILKRLCCQHDIVLSRDGTLAAPAREDLEAPELPGRLLCLEAMAQLEAGPQDILPGPAPPAVALIAWQGRVCQLIPLEGNMELVNAMADSTPEKMVRILVCHGPEDLEGIYPRFRGDCAMYPQDSTPESPWDLLKL